MRFWALCASLAESIAISLITLFLYTIIGPGAGAPGASGLLQRSFHTAQEIAGDSTLVLGGLILTLVMLKVFLSMAYSLLASVLKNLISERARNAIYTQYLRVSYGYIRTRDYGELVNIIGTESWNVAEAFYCLTRIGSTVCALAVFGAVLFSISWQIAVAAAMASVVTSAGLQALSRRAQRLGEAALETNSTLAEQMVNTLHDDHLAVDSHGFRLRCDVERGRAALSSPTAPSRA